MIGNTKYISHSDGLETLASRENQSESEFLASILKYASSAIAINRCSYTPSSGYTFLQCYRSA